MHQNKLEKKNKRGGDRTLEIDGDKSIDNENNLS